MSKSSQSGSAILWVLIAVALFGAISAVMSRGSRTSTTMLTDEQTKTAASQMIAFGNDVSSAVRRLVLRGCQDTDISFENGRVSGYANTNNPPDSCKVFHPNGGGLQLPPPPSAYAQPVTNFYLGQYAFMNNNAWHGNGTTCTNASCVDLVMIVHPLDETICTQINKTLGLSATPTTSALGGGQFAGTYTYVSTFAGEPNGLIASGKGAACFQRTSDNVYIYAHLILSR